MLGSLFSPSSSQFSPHENARRNDPRTVLEFYLRYSFHSTHYNSTANGTAQHTQIKGKKCMSLGLRQIENIEQRLLAPIPSPCRALQAGDAGPPRDFCHSI